MGANLAAANRAALMNSDSDHVVTALAAVSHSKACETLDRCGERGDSD